MQAVGHYYLIRPLGEGGMGTVYLAQHAYTHHYAVVKSLHPHYAQNEALRQRFYTEGQVMAKVSHPDIVRLYDFVVQEGVPYLIIEYVQGTPLDELLSTRGALSPEETYHVLMPMLAALHYLHKQKIIHRDIKPSNIMVLPGGGAKLIDFGIAKALDADYKLTQTGTQVGTVLYMSPEQIRGQEVSHQADLYAMGLVCYECLFGSFPWPWQGKTQFQLYQMLLTEPPPIPAWTPPGWRTFFETALAKEPQDRFHSASEMQRAYELLVLPRATETQVPIEEVSPTPSSPHQEPPEPSIRSKPDITPLTSSPKLSTPTHTPPADSSVAPTPTRKRPLRWPFVIGGAVLIIGAFVVLNKIRERRRAAEAEEKINSMLSAYNAANERAVRKALISHLSRQIPDLKVNAVNILSTPQLSGLSRSEKLRFSEGEPIEVTGTLQASVEYSYQTVQEETVEETCTYTTGFFFWKETHEGHRQVTYRLYTSRSCTGTYEIYAYWILNPNGFIDRKLENITELKEDCQEGEVQRVPWTATECE